MSCTTSFNINIANTTKILYTKRLAMILFTEKRTQRPDIK